MAQTYINVTKEDCAGNTSPAGYKKKKKTAMQLLARRALKLPVYGVTVHKQYYIILFEHYSTCLI